MSHQNVNGITPARAGKRDQQNRQQSAGRDHPRACGEKDEFGVVKPRLRGSPPRVRGKGSASAPSAPLPGITPARAGKSHEWLKEHLEQWDHPRACGEKQNKRVGRDHNKGSPPRVRGKEAVRPQQRCDRGITPARAGKRLKRIPYLLFSCAKHLFTPQFCVDNLCQLAVGHSAVSLNIR